MTAQKTRLTGGSGIKAGPGPFVSAAVATPSVRRRLLEQINPSYAGDDEADAEATDTLQNFVSTESATPNITINRIAHSEDTHFFIRRCERVNSQTRFKDIAPLLKLGHEIDSSSCADRIILACPGRRLLIFAFDAFNLQESDDDVGALHLHQLAATISQTR